MRRALWFIGVLVACRKGSDPPGVPDGSVPGSVIDATFHGQSLLPARCRATGQGMVLDPGGSGDLDMGDGLAFAGGYAVSLLRHTNGGPRAAVALLDNDAGGARVLDLGPTPSDAPPPRLAQCRTQLVAAAFGPREVGDGGSDSTRALGLFVVHPEAVERTGLVIEQHRDDSLAFDVACSGGAGLAVWDETTTARRGGVGRGVVRAAVFELGQHAARVRDVSPPESDAEMPRVVSSGAGFFVVWLAHRPETPTGPSEASANIEAPGELRAYGWIEMIAVDAEANPIGPLRRLSSTTGHVSAYDVRRTPERSEGSGANNDVLPRSESAMWVVSRDDGEDTEGAGGTLHCVRARLDGIESPVLLPADGLGRGAPAFVEGPEPWLNWVGPHERLRLLPLDSSGEAIATASTEEGLDEARPLLSLGHGRILVASPNTNPQLRVFACDR